VSTPLTDCASTIPARGPGLHDLQLVVADRVARHGARPVVVIAPAREVPVDRPPRRKVRRQLTPRTARAHDVQDRVDELASRIENPQTSRHPSQQTRSERTRGDGFWNSLILLAHRVARHPRPATRSLVERSTRVNTRSRRSPPACLGRDAAATRRPRDRPSLSRGSTVDSAVQLVARFRSTLAALSACRPRKSHICR
jgi:hypothetical protein